MSDLLRDIVRFRGDRLFNGAVNIGWFGSDEIRTRAAAGAFVFHGPAYHGVSQADVGVAHGHRLQDTASFARSIVRRCYGIEDQPFTLAIAGYGTGKSHLGLTLGALLSQPAGDTADAILEGIDSSDPTIGSEIRAILSEAQKPCLVVALNGMQSFDLTTEVTRQILAQVKAAELDTQALDELRPRFAQAASLIRIASANTDIVDELVTVCEAGGIDEILKKLEQQDESVYSRVHQVLAAKNIKISALGGESVRDVIDVAAREYCGTGKTFKCIVVLFDEFGRYTEFATVRSHIAGSGVLQDLFEGIQANAGAACFAGFIQFELNAYVQRVAPEHRNEILRYVTRYQAANRAYLSINLETLTASLIEKRKPQHLDEWFDNKTAKQKSEEIAGNIEEWFPQSRNHRLWNDPDQFHNVIRKGCWPLSAYSTWFLFHLAAAGKHLQERSALALLGDAFDRFQEYSVDADGSWSLSPVDFWSTSLQHELITSEEGGQQGAITHAYAAVEARHGSQLDANLKKILQAVVLASKMGLKASDRDGAVKALSEVAGLNLSAADMGIRLLQNEYNVLEWDEAFKEFDILGDAVPRTQFLAFVRQRVASTYDEAGKSALFASKAATWCDLLGDLDCDFAEENKITTREWRYLGITSNLDILAMQMKLASDRWAGALGIDEPRGTIIYCYVDPSRDAEAVATDTAKLLRAAAKESGLSALPILVVLLCDEDGIIGQSLAELAVLDESISEEDRVRFGHLIPAHKEKKREVVRSQVESMIKRRLYITAFKEPLNARRLSRVGTELFARIYKNTLVFPFDGFSTTRGNAADSCQELTSELLLGRLDYDAVIGKPVRIKNRALSVLKDAWGIFAQNGTVRSRPIQPNIRALTEKWDNMLASGDCRIPIGSALRQLCAPPYGANLASAGMFLGVFIAARVEKLSIIRGDQSYSVSKWVQNGIFRGKFIDISSMNDVMLILLGKESSEWEVLLDEWEQAVSYYDRVNYFNRALELKKRVPVPPVHGYRLAHLESQAQESATAIGNKEEKLNGALNKLEKGFDREDIGQLAWGAAMLLELRNNMALQSPLWAEQQIKELDPLIERGRQASIQFFPGWLLNQSPKSDSLDAMGDFKHYMLRLVGGNLKKLGLEDQCQELEKRVAFLVRNAEAAAAANQLTRDITSWLDQHSDVFRIARVAEVRGQHSIGKEFSLKLQGMARRVEIPEINTCRQKLSDFLNQLKITEKKLLKKAEALWQSKLRSIDDIDSVSAEIDVLLPAFDGCETDIEDLRIMKRVLSNYRANCLHLQNELLTWQEFDTLSKKLKEEAISAFGEEEVPWPPEQAFGIFIEEISKYRNAKSLNWIQQVELDAGEVANMDVMDANRLHEKAYNPPAWLSDQHSKRLMKTKEKIVARLDFLEIDWLIEKFKNLPAHSKKSFIKIATDIFYEESKKVNYKQC
jgi:hypothetical protein